MSELVAYRGHITDTTRWEEFRHRSDDIFICTPAKCGTTWTQAICAMLVFGTSEHGRRPGVISPWIDANFAPIEEYLAQVDAQTHRRFIKTHTPFDGIPYFPACTYLVVLRDPRDAYLSGLDHRANLTDPALAAQSFPTDFDVWLNRAREPGGWDRESLDTMVHFFKTYWHRRDRANVHLYHYADMTRDLRGAIASMAAACRIDVSDAQLDAYAAAAKFESMQAKPEQFAPMSGTGIWKAERDFFPRGRNAQWQQRLSAAELAAFDARLAALLPADEAAWLRNGNG